MFLDLAVGVSLLLFAGRNFGDHPRYIVGTISAVGGVYAILRAIHIATHNCSAVPGVLM
jgi:hypothetical protein